MILFFVLLATCLLLLRDVPSLVRKKGSFLILTTTARTNSDDVFGAAFPCEHFYRRHLGFSQPRGKRFLSLKIASNSAPLQWRHLPKSRTNFAWRYSSMFGVQKDCCS